MNDEPTSPKPHTSYADLTEELRQQIMRALHGSEWDVAMRLADTLHAVECARSGTSR